jgi:hypothetical protein
MKRRNFLKSAGVIGAVIPALATTAEPKKEAFKVGLGHGYMCLECGHQMPQEPVSKDDWGYSAPHYILCMNRYCGQYKRRYLRPTRSVEVKEA